VLTRNYVTHARTANGINVFLGISLLVSPWVFGYQAAGAGAIWNSVIVGALIAVLAASSSFSKAHPHGTLLDQCIAGSVGHDFPVVFGYTANAGGVGDNMILAVLIAALSICADGARTAGEQRPPPHAPAH
jgi:SPW repeat